MSSELVRGASALAEEEEQRLAPYATCSREAARRRPLVPGGGPDLRLAFQRDRDRILHARAFRRLKHKTQVFVPHLADHPRTRLTHTLEVAQLGRTIARALGLNEDLVEAIALGHDLGHTAFGHTGERVLDEILRGTSAELRLPSEVVAEAGRFKHNYQSLRVVDLLERRYARPGLNLTDQVREGILKHTTWKAEPEFPLPDLGGLNLRRACHIEGQVVAVADEIAQQTHDLEDGLRAGAVTLEAVERLAVARRVAAGQDAAAGRGRWLRQSALARGMIDLFVGDVVVTSAAAIERFCARRRIADREAWRRHRAELSQTTIALSTAGAELLDELKGFIYTFIINHAQVNRQDWRAQKVVAALFTAFWRNPLNLPSYVLLRAREELGLPYLREMPLPAVAAEVDARYHSSSGFARLIADHIAGMSDRFALEEYRSLEQPAPDQSFAGDLR